MGKKGFKTKGASSAIAFLIGGLSLQLALFLITDALSRELIDMARIAVGLLAVSNCLGWFVACFALKRHEDAN